MDYIVKAKYYTDACKYMPVTEEEFVEFMKHPIIRKNKDYAPLGCFATVKKPWLPAADDYDSLAAVAENISSYDCLQVDYDSGMSVKDFIARYKAVKFWLYTSYNHGFKGEFDRFRAVFPLDGPMSQDIMGRAYKQYMMKVFPGCDMTCFDRAHFQLLPCIRSEEAIDKYTYYINDVDALLHIDIEEIHKIEEDNRHKQYICNMFEDARALFNDELYGHRDEDDYERRVTNQLKFAQSLLETAVIGQRHNICFQVVCYLNRKGLLDYAWSLTPPHDAAAEWKKCLDSMR